MKTNESLNRKLAHAVALLATFDFKFTPEYNRSIPGMFKNAIDHASPPYGQSVWGGKPVGAMGDSVGAQAFGVRWN